MKKLLTLALLVSAVASAHDDISATEVTAENCVKCLQAGTTKDALLARIAELVAANDISEEVAAACVEAINSFEAEEVVAAAE